MADINAANLQLRLSGGASNSQPNLSLGGVMSTSVMNSQNTTSLSLITGVLITFAGGLTVGSPSTLRHQYTGGVHYLSVMDPQDGSYGPNVDVSAGGLFYLSGSNRGSLAVDVTAGSLPVTTVTEQFTVTNIKNNLFDDVLKIDALNGSVEYRCIYLLNTHPTDAFLSVSVYGYGGSGNPAAAGDLFYVGADPAGAGNGATTGVATTIADEDTAPSGVAFSSPVIATPLSLGPILAGEARAIWLRRNVPSNLYAVTPDDYVSFGLKLIY